MDCCSVQVLVCFVLQRFTHQSKLQAIRRQVRAASMRARETVWNFGVVYLESRKALRYGATAMCVYIASGDTALTSIMGGANCPLCEVILHWLGTIWEEIAVRYTE